MISLLLLTVFMANEICGTEGQAVGSGDEVSPSSSRGSDLCPLLWAASPIITRAQTDDLIATYDLPAQGYNFAIIGKE